MSMMALATLSIVASAPTADAAALSQGYRADEVLAPGTMVSLGNNTNGTVVPATIDNNESLIGVVVGSSSIELTGPGRSLHVSNSGATGVYVSDLNGPVHAGDAIIPSPIAGVGMRAISAGKIVGIAQGDVSAGDTKTVSVTRNDGRTTNVTVGLAPVALQVGYYTPPTEKSPLPGFLQVFANAIAGHQVPVLRIVAALLMVIIGLAVVGVMLFSAVHSTLVSLGRNPLAKSSIYHGLWQVFATSAILLVGAFGGAYIVLTR